MLRKIGDQLAAKIREKEIARLRQLILDSPRGASVVLVGPSGVGKSLVLQQLRKFDVSKSPGPIADAIVPTNRTRLGLAASIIGSHPIGKASEFVHLAAKARFARSSAQTTHAALQCFEASLDDLSKTQNVVYVDNVDLGSQRTIDWLLSTIKNSHTIRIVATAQSARRAPPGLQPIETYSFTRDQTNILLDAWKDSLPCDLGQFADALSRATSGNAVSICLAAWAISRCKEEPRPYGDTLVRLVQHGTDAMPPSERELWLCSLAARVRIAPAIISDLSNGQDIASFFAEFENLPFVTKKSDLFGGYVIHSIAEATLSEALRVTPQELLELRGRLCHEIYPKITSRQIQPEVLSELFLERLGYLTDYDLPTATDEIQSAFVDAARGGRLNDAEAVASVAEHVLESGPERAPIELHLLSAENALLEHLPENALKILGAIPISARYSNDVLLTSRYNYLRADLRSCDS